MGHKNNRKIISVVLWEIFTVFVIVKYDYIVVSTAGNSDERFAEFPTVFVVRREGVPFVYVKKPQ